LTRGASNKRIARDLNIAEATVKAHIKSVLRKLRVNNRTQAALWAINHTTRAEPDPTQSAAEP
jgi:two-component system nitrate/nitrite response regulator NarL